LAELPRTRAQCTICKSAPALAHLLEPVLGRERTDERRLRPALDVAHEVQAPVDAVRAIDVREPGRTEHHRVARGRPAERMTRRILLVVRLDLDDRAADAVDEERHADQVGRHLVHRAGEEVTPEHVDPVRARPLAEAEEDHLRRAIRHHGDYRAEERTSATRSWESPSNAVKNGSASVRELASSDTGHIPSRKP